VTEVGPRKHVGPREQVTEVGPREQVAEESAPEWGINDARPGQADLALNAARETES
jgi:hypothetical protein